MQRSLPFRLFNLFLAVVVLTTSTGFGLIERSCLMRTQKTYSLTRQDIPATCANPAKSETKTNQRPTVKKDKCCADQDVYKNVSFTEMLAQKAAQGAKAVADVAVNVCEWAVDGLVAAILSFIDSSADSSTAAVPLAGRSLLAFVQSLLL